MYLRMYVHTLIVDMCKNIWGQCMAHTYARKYIVMIIITHTQKHLQYLLIMTFISCYIR